MPRSGSSGRARLELPYRPDGLCLGLGGAPEGDGEEGDDEVGPGGGCDAGGPVRFEAEVQEHCVYE